MFGITAGAAGIITTGYNAIQDVSRGKSLTQNSALGASSFAMVAGAGLVFFGGGGGDFRTTVLRGAGAALLGGGLIAAAHGAVDRFGSDHRASAPASTQVQEPSRFDVALPARPADMAGIKIGTAIVRTNKNGRGETRIPMYVDATAKATKSLAPGTSLADAISQARAYSQGDANNRAYAVLQASDGNRFLAPLTGDLDQIDGRFYATDNSFDPVFEPTITKKHPALQAVVGVESRVVFPAGTDPAEPAQDAGDVPWVEPSFAPTSPPKPAAPATTTTGGGAS